MNKKFLVLSILIPLTILGILPGAIIPRAHGALTGIVCIATVADVTSKCPTSAPSFSGPLTTPNTLLRVPIMINDTDSFNGYDVTVNSTKDTSGKLSLTPYGVDLTGSVSPVNSITLAECIGTVALVGNACATNSTIDNPTSIRAAVIFPSFVPVGTTGLLFTAIFAINGTTIPGGVNINFQNHCDPTTSSDGQICVAIGNGTKSGAPETVLTGGFDNSAAATLPSITLTTPTLNLGQSLIGAPTHALPTVTYTVTSQNGFNNTAINPGPTTVSLAATINGSGTRPTVMVAPSSVDLLNVPRQTFTQTGSVSSTVPVGVYIATATATYQTQDPTFLNPTIDALSAAYALTVNVTDYVFSTSLTTVPIMPPGSQPVIATVTPKASFNNLVKLGITIPAATASAGIGATFNAYTISGGSGTSTLTITTSTNTPGGSFTITVTSNSTLSGFTVQHSKTLTINTVGFTLSATNPSSQITGTAEASTITITYANGFTGTVTLTNNTITNLTCTVITPSSVTATGTATTQCTSNVKGTYILTIVATSGSNSLTTTATFNFIVGFTLSVNSPSAHPVGTAATATVTVTYLTGFTGTVALTNNTATNLSCLAMTPASLTATGTATIQCVSMVQGTYALTITGTNGPNSLSATATFNYTVQIHDVTVTATITPTGSANVGATITASVQVQNKGTQSENVTVSFYAGNQTVQSKSVVLAAGAPSQTVILTWVTTSYAAKMYNLSVQVQLPGGEINQESGQQTTSTSPVSFTLQSTTQSPGLDTTTIAIIAGIIVVIAILGSLLVIRMRKKSSSA